MGQQPSHKIIRIIIAGGGTGGHIFPAIAVANAIQAIQPEAVILFVGAKGKMEMEKVPQAGYAIKGLTIAGLNRSHWFKNWSLPFKLLKSYFEVKSIFKSFQPNAVFGVGGYSSFPVLKYAQSKGIATFIHESNAFAGKANQWLSADATSIFTGTSGMEKFFPAHKTILTGNPVRKNIIHHHFTNESALLQFGLLPGKKTILIMGGSLGAASINKVIQHHLPHFLELGVQLIWQTGKTNAAQYLKASESYKNVYVSSFIDNMSAAYAAADIVISRSGAMAVAEICIAGKAAIFVPYPHAAEDHQTFNAMQLVHAGAAEIVKDQDADSALFPCLQTLIQDEDKRNEMKHRITSFVKLNADEVIAETILKNIQEINHSH
jgi:UDP-N-acetylglucosamine--N-acetylmuramyl-(pentapeptide) pyrophosphoryl-undecaprenol N-acetylglucosamine transferase